MVSHLGTRSPSALDPNTVESPSEIQVPLPPTDSSIKLARHLRTNSLMPVLGKFIGVKLQEFSTSVLYGQFSEIGFCMADLA